MRSALIQKAALRTRSASVASSLQFTKRLQSSWTPALPAGQSAAYDEALAFLAQHKEKRLAQLSILQERLSEVKGDEERSVLQREMRKAEIEAWVNDPETRELFNSGRGDMDKEVFRWLAERQWRKEGGLDLLMQRLLQMNVVPDLIPSILPTANLSVSIPSQSSAPIEPGSFLPPAALSQPPQLSLQVFSPGTKQYTLLMLDPDSPDAMAETFTTKVHWIVPNITISPTASQIDSSAPALVPYLAPNPEKGTPYHRYTFLAFAQPEGVQFSVGGSEGKAVSVPEQRTGFNLREWLNEAGLDASAAVGANMVRGVWSDPVKAARVAKAAAAAPGGKRAYSTMSRRSMFASSSRPVMTGAATFGAASTRAYSWTPWKKSSDVVTPHQAQEAVFPVAVTPGAQDATPEPVHLDAATSAAPSTLPAAGPSSIPAQTASAPVHEPILETPHPDLLSGSAPNFMPPQSTTAVEGTSRTFEEMLRSSPSDMEAVLQSPEAIHAALKVSDLKLLGLEHGWFNIVGWLRDGLVGLNQYTDLPWWMTIAAFTVTLRLAIFPWVLKIQSHNARLAAVNPQIKALMEKLNTAKASGDFTATQVVNQSMATLFKAHDVHPLRSLLLPVLQMPLFFSMFWALKGFAALPLPMLKDGGFGWVTDLTVADPYYILPTTSMMLTLGVLELGGDGTGDANKSRQMAHFKNAFRVISVGLIPFVGSMPAAVLFYWTFSNGMTLIQASLLKAQWFRRLFNLPMPPKVPPPPGPVEGPPTMMDTWRAARDMLTPSRNPMFQQAMKEHQLRMDELAKTKGRKPGMGEIQEFVQEASTQPVAARGQDQAWLEDESRPNMARSAEEARRQRVAAARERRSRPTAKQ